MPCYVTGSAEGDAQLAASEAREEATKATRMLCEVLGKLESKGRNIKVADFSNEVISFWTHHKEIDEQRKREEAKKQNEKL